MTRNGSATAASAYATVQLNEVKNTKLVEGVSISRQICWRRRGAGGGRRAKGYRSGRRKKKALILRAHLFDFLWDDISGAGGDGSLVSRRRRDALIRARHTPSGHGVSEHLNSLWKEPDRITDMLYIERLQKLIGHLSGSSSERTAVVDVVVAPPAATGGLKVQASRLEIQILWERVPRRCVTKV
ncbi:hypothetical protein EVAR_78397_1 [Eumeta japonica]|uniref:Uncharacterized protein n=1 Tax=Eumeta variegata TaxID=151549 RepID=A0A4C1T4N3_EUMVA|nr:hypothetical protein EVAR_78397_1 [Eumeta japonica]